MIYIRTDISEIICFLLKYVHLLIFPGFIRDKSEILNWIIKFFQGTSLVAQWMRLQAPNAGGPGSIPGQGTRPHMHATTKSSHATTREACAPHQRTLRAVDKTQCSQINT